MGPEGARKISGVEVEAAVSVNHQIQTSALNQKWEPTGRVGAWRSRNR